MKAVVCLLLTFCFVGAVGAKPLMDRSNEARKFLLEKNDAPALKTSYIRPSQWFITRGENGKGDSVGAVTQRLWRRRDQMEFSVETAIFPSRQDALKAAELRVKELKDSYNLQEQSLREGAMPGQANGDKVWGLYDPPETNQRISRCRNIGPISKFAAVVFVKKEVVVQVTANSQGGNVDLGDLEALARKVAAKTKPPSEQQGQTKQEPKQ